MHNTSWVFQGVAAKICMGACNAASISLIWNLLAHKMLATLNSTVIYGTLAIVVVTFACCMANPGDGKEGKTTPATLHCCHTLTVVMQCTLKHSPSSTTATFRVIKDNHDGELSRLIVIRWVAVFLLS